MRSSTLHIKTTASTFSFRTGYRLTGAFMIFAMQVANQKNTIPIFTMFLLSFRFTTKAYQLCCGQFILFIIALLTGSSKKLFSSTMPVVVHFTKVRQGILSRFLTDFSGTRKRSGQVPESQAHPKPDKTRADSQSCPRRPPC